MNSNRYIFLLLACSALSLTVGIAAGYFLRLPENKSSLADIKNSVAANINCEPKSASDSNKTIKFISEQVSGSLTSISSDSLTISEKNDSLTFKINQETKITKLSLNSSNPQVRETITVNQLKNGNMVDAILYSQPDGTFLAQEVRVIVEE